MPPSRARQAQGDAGGGGEGLLVAVSGNRLATYLASAGRAGRHNAGEVAKELTRKQLTDVCSALDQQVSAAVASVQQAQEEQEQGQEQDTDVIRELGEVLQVLKGASLLANTLLSASHSSPPDNLLSTAMALHDSCLLAVGDLPELQDPVCKLCCSWWELQAPGREQLMAQTLPYILIRAEASGRAADIKTCFTMRDAFALLDYEDPTIVDVKRLLLQVSFSPSFLQRQEGRRFLASLFKLDVSLVGELTAIMKNQICSGRKSVLEGYGEIIFRAWKETTGPCLLELETTCIQELMQAAILASTQPLAAALRTVLHGLHSEKRVAGVDALLLRLYRPILFRAFTANNAAVRLNALHLLLDAFPLMDPDAGPEEMEEVLTRQFELLRSCLSDACPLLRTVAVGGVSKLLNLFWELIPAVTTAALVRQLTGELAFDMSSPPVRCAVLDGLGPLLDNPHAQPVLRKALPQLAALLSDPSLKVRESMATLLCALSSSRAIHFYDVVPLGLLLDAMSQDSPSVSTRIQSILVPSYFPNPEEGSARVAMLLKANPAAGQAFCGYLVSSWVASGAGVGGFRASVPIEHVLQLAVDLKGHLLATAEAVGKVLREREEAAVAETRGRKKQKKAGGKAGGKAGKAAKQPATGKRRKAAKPAGVVVKSEDGGEAGVNAELEDGEEDEEEAVIVMDDAETVEGWCAIAGGLAALVFGLAAAVEQEQVGPGDLAEAIEEEELVALYESSPSDEARCSILRIVALMPYLPASAAVRSRLLSDIATGKLRLGVGALEAVAADAARLADDEAEVQAPSLPTSEAVRTLCGHSSGAKLAAMAMSALGLRPSGTIHLPGPKPAPKKAAAPKRRTQRHQQEEEEEEDDEKCCVCDQGQPEESLMLCDGCDAGYHMECLVPALTALPEGAWFCHRCEQDVQLCTMGWRQALACVSSAMAMPEGRTSLSGHSQFVPLLEGLRGMAHQETQLLLRDIAAGRASGSGHGEGEGVGATGGEVVGLYCRSALHLALSTLLDPPPEAEPRTPHVTGGKGKAGAAKTVGGRARGAGGVAGEGGELEEEEGGLTPHTGGSGDAAMGRPSAAQALTAMVNALNEGVEMCEEVLEVLACSVQQGGPRRRALGFGAGPDGEGGEVEEPEEARGGAEGAGALPHPGLAARCLEFVGSVLSVVADAQKLQVLDLGGGVAGAAAQGGGEAGLQDAAATAGLQQVTRFCELGARVASAAAAVLEPSGDGAAVAATATAGAKPAERVRAALRHVMCIALQMVQSVGAAAAGAGGQQAGAAQQEAGGAVVGDAALSALAQLDGMAAQVLRSVLGTSTGRLLQSIRQPLTTLLTSLLDQGLAAKSVKGQAAPVHGWLEALSAAVGRAVEAGQGVKLGADEEEGAVAEEQEGAAGEEGADAAGARDQGRARRAGRRSSRAKAVQGGPEQEGEGREGSPEVEEEQEEGDNGGAEKKGKAGAGVQGRALTAAAARADASVVLACRVVLSLIKARGVGGRELALGQLGGVAGECWQRGDARAALGAVHLIGLLGFSGMRGRRLRLTGAEVNTLLKLEMLQKGVEDRLQQQQGQEEEEGGRAGKAPVAVQALAEALQARLA